MNSKLALFISSYPTATAFFRRKEMRLAMEDPDELLKLECLKIASDIVMFRLCLSAATSIRLLVRSASLLEPSPSMANEAKALSSLASKGC